MTDIAEFERRITAALDRAQKALEDLSAGESQDAAALAAELEAERVANQQLEERVRAIKDKQETMVAGLEANVAEMETTMGELKGTVATLETELAQMKEALTRRDGELQTMRGVNEALRQSNDALRNANAEGLADAALVNSAMGNELDSLRAARAAERAEIEEILATLEPVLKEA
ncbi:MAG: hypothetical protein OIF48_02350 [Silicimonas sp.]|nr:hypothetical protein [Silicimonas sp.]